MSAESGKRVAARITDEDLIDAVDAAADEHGSRSEALRAALRETYGDREETADVAPYLPDDPQVRRGYEILCEEAAPYTARIDAEAAQSRIADRLNIPSGSVKRRIIAPLTRQRVGGSPVVEPKWGVLIVMRPEELAAVAGGEGGE